MFSVSRGQKEQERGFQTQQTGVSQARVAAQPGVGGGGTPIPGGSRSEKVDGAGLRVLSAW